MPIPLYKTASISELATTPDLPDAELRRSYHDACSALCAAKSFQDAALPDIEELSTQLRRAAASHDLLDFDQADPLHWRAALDQVLQEELTTHITPEDLRVVRAVLALMRAADRMGTRQWGRFVLSLNAEAPAEPEEVILDEVEVPTPKDVPRCAPDDPQPGHLNYEDALDDPPHGTQTRYNGRHQCRCEYCRKANTEYRKHRRLRA